MFYETINPKPGLSDDFLFFPKYSDEVIVAFNFRKVQSFPKITSTSIRSALKFGGNFFPISMFFTQPKTDDNMSETPVSAIKFPTAPIKVHESMHTTKTYEHFLI